MDEVSSVVDVSGSVRFSTTDKNYCVLQGDDDDDGEYENQVEECIVPSTDRSQDGEGNEGGRRMLMKD